MFPYTGEEAEWLSAHADRHYWLLGQGDLQPAVPVAPAAKDAPPCGRDKVAPAAA
jgi:hypothetical protein